MSHGWRSCGVVRIYDDSGQHSGAVDTSAQDAPLLPGGLAGPRDYLKPDRPAVEDGTVRFWVLQIDHLEGHLFSGRNQVSILILRMYVRASVRVRVRFAHWCKPATPGGTRKTDSFGERDQLKM